MRWLPQQASHRMASCHAVNDLNGQPLAGAAQFGVDEGQNTSSGQDY
jgi:hypothetical protein